MNDEFSLRSSESKRDPVTNGERADAENENSTGLSDEKKDLSLVSLTDASSIGRNSDTVARAAEPKSAVASLAPAAGYSVRASLPFFAIQADGANSLKTDDTRRARNEATSLTELFASTIAPAQPTESLNAKIIKANAGIPLTELFASTVRTSPTDDVSEDRRSGRAIRATRVDLSVTAPEEMKFGAAWNAWDRITPGEQKDLASKIRNLSEGMIQRSQAIARSERTTHGFVIKRDPEGRVVSLENPAKNLRMHFKYEGKSDTVAALVTENTKTKETKAYLAVQKSKDEAIGGKREWVSVDSKGKAGYLSGEVSVGKTGGHSVRLESRDKARELIEALKPAVKRSELDVQKENLQEVAERTITNPSARVEYLKNMDRFQNAAKERGLSEKETASFFKESAKLLSSVDERFVKNTDKIRVASEALKQALDPTTITQGRYKTCNVTTVEVCMYSRNPSKAMKAITEASLTGKFTTAADGAKIDLPRSAFNPATRGRTFASQIFQDLAVNTYWNLATSGPDGKTYKKGDIKYNHEGAPRVKDDTGQRLTTIAATGKIIELKKSPTLNTDLYPEIYRRIAGEKPETLSLKLGLRKSDVEGVKNIESAAKFHETLAELSKKPGGLPVILRIHTSNPPFWSDSNEGTEPGAGASSAEVKKTGVVPGGWHVVTIHGYDAKTKMVAVDNTWDRASDHLAKKDTAGKIPVDVLFAAMRTHKERLLALGFRPELKAKLEKEKEKIK